MGGRATLQRVACTPCAGARAKVVGPGDALNGLECSGPDLIPNPADPMLRLDPTQGRDA